MAKTVHLIEYHVAMGLLLELRRKAKLTQGELATRMGKPQSFVSDTEAFARRLDIIQINAWVLATGWTLPRFATELVKRWAAIPPADRGKAIHELVIRAPKRARKPKKA